MAGQAIRDRIKSDIKEANDLYDLLVNRYIAYTEAGDTDEAKICKDCALAVMERRDRLNRIYITGRYEA